jgi:hypothetical protein
MNKRLFLHIGLPKTGSTAFQRLLGPRRPDLRAQGLRFFRGRFSRNNHVEVFLSCIREGVDTFSSLKHDLPARDLLWQDTRTALAAFSQKAASDAILISTEGLSFLREPDELTRLAGLLPPDRDVTILFVRRDRASFLKSYKSQITKQPGRTKSDDPRSALYVEDDTWLTDFDQLEAVYRNQFNDVRVFDYHPTDILPALVRELGLDLGDAPRTTFRNVTDPASQA